MKTAMDSDSLIITFTVQLTETVALCDPCKKVIVDCLIGQWQVNAEEWWATIGHTQTI